MNDLLFKQLKQIFGDVDKLPQELAPLVELVSNTYNRYGLVDVESKAVNDNEINQLGKLRNRVSLLENFIDYSSDALQISDEEGNFVFVNAESSRRLGYSVEELLKMNVKQVEVIFQAEGVWQQHVAELRALMPKPILIEGRNLNHDGTVIPVEANVRLVELDGRYYVMALIRDISQRVQAQITQQRLIEELKSVNDDLKEFAYIISHDLKAPLRGINTLAEWLVNDYAEKLDEEGVSHLKFIQKRANRMHTLIDGVLQYSRVGRIKEDAKEIDIKHLIFDIADILTSSTRKLEIHILNELPILYIEETHTRQILQNLIGNALKHCDKEVCKVEIGYKQQDDLHIFSVKDNGPGIEARHQERVFRIFETLDDNSENSENTGIGLTIVKKIVENKGGRVWLESTFGKGATFFFSLPVRTTTNPMAHYNKPSE